MGYHKEIREIASKEMGLPTFNAKEVNSSKIRDGLERHPEAPDEDGWMTP